MIYMSDLKTISSFHKTNKFNYHKRYHMNFAEHELYST